MMWYGMASVKHKNIPIARCLIPFPKDFQVGLMQQMSWDEVEELAMDIDEWRRCVARRALLHTQEGLSKYECNY